MQLTGIAISFILLVILSCHQSITPGTYTSYKASPIEVMEFKLHGLSGYNGGTTLKLESDSQFVYTTCGHILNGIWSEAGDSLYLEVKEPYKRLDSIQNIAIPLDSVPYYKNGISFEIRSNKLFNVNFNYATKLKRRP